jgi:baculoviral IAP repeat-containing protein 6
MQLSALGNKIEAIKQKQASIGKSIKLQSSKHFKDLLQIRKNEILLKRGLLSSKSGREETCTTADIEINLNLEPKLCSNVAKGLGLLLLRMDSTCHSDVYLITCKALARIATACRPVISLGSIFSSKQLINLILNAVGSDYVRQKNWSSPWVSHAVMCLIQDILEAEKLFPVKPGDKPEPEPPTTFTEDILSGVDDNSTATSGGSAVEDMSIDEVDSETGW